ncbi:MAG: helix-turn-helix transcriptional regulator, partial [Acidimicrobiia bacterium]
VRLRLLESRLPIRVDWDAARGLELAREAWELAQELGVEEAKARSLLGSAHLAAGEPAWMEHYDEARRIAIATGDVDTEAVVSNGLITAYFLNGESRRCIDFADASIARMRGLRLRGWELQMRSGRVGPLAMSFGRYIEAADEAEFLVRQPDLDRMRKSNYSILGYCHSCLGNAKEAAAAFEAARSIEHPPTAAVTMLIAQLEVDWWKRRLSHLEASADAGLAMGFDGYPTQPVLHVLREWARFELRSEVSESEPDIRFPVVRAVPIEIRALRQWARGEREAAVEAFEEAASAWKDVLVTGSMRCRWAQAELLSQLGQRDPAAELAEAAMEEARALHLAVVRPRLESVVRTARGASIRTRRGPAGLTLRELEVMSLVADGLASADIAARLAVTRSTVEGTVTSAMRKLDAATRLEAVATLQRMTSG